MDEKTVKLKEHYPESVVCIDMNGKMWIQMGDAKYDQVELFNITKRVYRVWLWGYWYYFSLDIE